ncbi:MAG: Ig-like domain-containing protein [Acidobacteriaceae bacterium]
MKRLVIFLLLLACALCAAAQTQVTLTASSPVALAGALVSFTATVSGTPSSAMPTSVIPTGTVTFEDGTTPIGDATLHTNLGLATGTFFTTSLAAGSHPIVALYSGDANFKAATSAATTIAIEAYSITPSATTLTLTQGQSGNLTYTVADGTGVSTIVDFGCVPPPSTYTTCSFSPASVTGNGQAVLTIATTGTTTASARGYFFRRLASKGPALASFLFLCFPLGLRLRRRFADVFVSTLMLALLLTGSITLTGCSSAKTTPAASTATPPGTQAFEVLTSTAANSQTIGQNTWITVTVLPAS